MVGNSISAPVGGTVASHGRSPTSADTAGIAGIFASLYLLGVYTGFTVYSGDGQLIFPFALANLAGIAYLGISLKRHRRTFDKVTLIVLGMAILCAFSILAAALGGGDWVSRTRAALQLAMSVLSATGAALAIRAIPLPTLGKVATGIAIALVAVSVLEIALLPRESVLALYQQLYWWKPTSVYLETARDENMWGGIRPLAFASEPSFVGIATGAMLLLSYATLATGRLGQIIKYVAAFAVAFVVVRSVTILFFMLLLPLWTPRARRARAVFVILLLSLVGFLVGMALFPSALDKLIGGYSFFARMVAPWPTAAGVLLDYPLFGVGIGGEEAVRPYIVSVWSDFGVLSGNVWAANYTVSNMITSAVAWPLIMFGVVGGIIFLLLFLAYLHVIGVRSLAAVGASIFVAWLTVGGFVDARSWSFVALFAALSVALRMRQSAQLR